MTFLLSKRVEIQNFDLSESLCAALKTHLSSGVDVDQVIFSDLRVNASDLVDIMISVASLKTLQGFALENVEFMHKKGVQWSDVFRKLFANNLGLQQFVMINVLIDKEVEECIGQMVSIHPSLKRLTLSRMAVSSAFFNQFAEPKFVSCRQLSTVDLTGIESDEWAKVIKQLTSSIKSLRKIYLRNIAFDPEVKTTLKDIDSKNDNIAFYFEDERLGGNGDDDSAKVDITTDLLRSVEEKRLATEDPFAALKHYQIRTAVRRGRKIGTGTTGISYCSDLFGLSVALKVFHDSENLMNRIRSEIAILARLNHPNILSVLGVVDVEEEPGRLAVVSKYVEGTTLEEIIFMDETMLHESEREEKGKEVKAGRRLPLMLVARFLSNVALAMWYLHEKGVFHRNLKPSNVMVSYDFREVLVSDFGFSMQYIEPESSSKKTYSVAEMCSLCFMDRYGTVASAAQSDVYSFGMLIVAMMTGKRPNYIGDSKTNQVSFEPKSMKGYLPEQLFDLYTKCCTGKPTVRPEFTEISRMLGEMNDIACPWKHAHNLVSKERGYVESLGGMAWMTEAITPDEEHLASFSRWMKFIRNRVADMEYSLEDVVKSVRFVRVPHVEESFERRIIVLRERLVYNKKSFANVWKESGSDHRKLRMQEFTIDALMAHLNRFTVNQGEEPKVCLTAHCTSWESALKICSGGFEALSRRDPGVFGQGIYSTFNIDYAWELYSTHPNSVILLSWTILGNVFPVVDHSIEGRAKIPACDAHFVLLQKMRKESGEAKYDVFTSVDLDPTSSTCKTEVVVFDLSQMLPFAILEMKRDHVHAAAK